jgi:hypothetical protein
MQLVPLGVKRTTLICRMQRLRIACSKTECVIRHLRGVSSINKVFGQLFGRPRENCNRKRWKL